MRTKRILAGLGFMVAYLLVVFLPLILIMSSIGASGRPFWIELSVGLAYTGLAMIGLQFVLTARLGWLKEPFGSDLVYFFHHKIAILAVVLVAAHPVVLFLYSSGYLALLNFSRMPLRVWMGLSALVLLALLVLAAVLRKKLHIEYFLWRVLHGLVAIAIVILALTHVIQAGTYIGHPWKAALWILYGVFWVATIFYARIIKAIILWKHPYRVEEVKPERGNVTTVVIAPLGHKGFQFKPGQFAWLNAWNKPGQGLEHPFSIVSSAEHPERLAFSIKALGNYTNRIKDIKAGQKVYVEGPYGAFSVDRYPEAGQFVFIAGGIGITPFMSALRTLADRHEMRPLLLLYANKTWDGVTFREEIEELKKRLNLRVVHVLELPPDGFKGESGYLNKEILEKYIPDMHKKHTTRIFICGPVKMMDSIERTLSALHINGHDLISERFDLV